MFSFLLLKTLENFVAGQRKNKIGSSPKSMES
jgi:hypothetical protein